VRLLTLVGTGGSGKTRIAIEIGHKLQNQFKDGAAFVNLSHLNDEKLVAQEITQTLGLAEVAGQTHLGLLKNYFRSLEFLLILDNFEHLLPAADIISELLSAAPGLKIIVTSRVVLHLYGEQELSVPPLDVPNLAVSEDELDLFALEQIEAMCLFVTRVQNVYPNFSLTNENKTPISQICIKLDGLPLAIELAAARIKSFSPPDLLQQLELHSFNFLNNGPINLPPRQQTMKATLDWSYNLLEPAEQQLFASLGIFRGGFTLDAVQNICVDADEPGDQTQNQLEKDGILHERLIGLLDKSLIWRGWSSPEVVVGNDLALQTNVPLPMRFTLLEMLRAYALQQLESKGKLATLKQRHIQYYTHFAEMADKGLSSPTQKYWLYQLDLEHDNLRGALDECLNIGEPSLASGLRLASALFSFWDIRCHYSEARSYLERLLEKAKTTEVANTRAYAWALNRIGLLAGRQGEYNQALVLLKQSLQLQRSLSDQVGEASSLNYLGVFTFLSGDYLAAKQLHQQSLELCQVTDDKAGLALILSDLGVVETALGNYDQAIHCHRQALAIFQERGDKRRTTFSLANLGLVIAQQHDYVNAQIYLHESISIQRELGDYRALAYTLRYYGSVALRQSNYQVAHSYFLESLNLSLRIGDRSQIGETLALLASLLYDITSDEQAQSSQMGTAVLLMGATIAQLENNSVALAPTHLSIFNSRLEKAKGSLGEEKFNSYYARGQQLTLRQILQDILLPISSPVI
jgi:predicted ATPase